MTPSQQAALDALFRDFARGDAPGLVVGVAQHGRTLYRRGLGLASIEHGVANTPATRMRIGSTSKQFTCLAVLLLAEDGLLDIDAPARRYLPELPDLTAIGEAEPTLHQLMTHTSGLRCYLDLGFISDGASIKPPGFARSTQLRQRESNFAPGTNMVYCNSGYQLLSWVIEQAAGIPFEDFLEQRIFTPLGMADTRSVPSDFELHPGVATLHVPTTRGWRRGIFPSEELRGEGAMVSTIDDMLRWLTHVRQPTLGSAATWRQMLAPTALASGLVNPYALGLMRHRYRGVEVIHHPGGVTGGASQMLTVPAEALDIIVISNGAKGASPRELANRIVDIMLGEDKLAAPEWQADGARFAPMLGRRYRGRDSGLVFSFAQAPGSKLGLRLINGPPVALRDDGAQLSLPFEAMAIGPFVLETAQLARAGAAPARLELCEAGGRESFDLLPEPPPTLAEAGAALAGRFWSPDLAAEATIRWQDDQLLLQIHGSYGGNLIALQPFSSEVFGCEEIDPNSLQPRSAVLRVEKRDGRITGFRIDTPRTRHLWFERLTVNTVINNPLEESSHVA